MMAANKSRLKPSQVVCQMGPLRRCIERMQGDISGCLDEVELFEKTCIAEGYIHDRDGLDDPRTGIYGDKKQP